MTAVAGGVRGQTSARLLTVRRAWLPLSHLKRAQLLTPAFIKTVLNPAQGQFRPGWAIALGHWAGIWARQVRGLSPGSS